MGIFQRISDIIAANLNDLIEKNEDPEKMLREKQRCEEPFSGQNTGEMAKKGS